MTSAVHRLDSGHSSLGSLIILTAAAEFGTLAIFGKLATEFALELEPLLVFRFIIATSIIWLTLFITGRVRFLSGRPLGIALGIGVVYALMTWFFFVGLKSMNAGTATIIFYTYPIHVFLLSSAFLGERITRTKLVALALSLAGVLLIIGGGKITADFFGIGLILAAAIAYAVYTSVSRVVLGQVEPLHLTSTAMVATTICMIPLALGSGNLSISSGYNQWGVVIGIAVLGTSIPILLLITGLQYIEASRASVIGTSEPLATVMLGVAILGEPLTPTIILGGASVLLGVLIIQRDAPPSSMVAH